MRTRPRSTLNFSSFTRTSGGAAADAGVGGGDCGAAADRGKRGALLRASQYGVGLGDLDAVERRAHHARLRRVAADRRLHGDFANLDREVLPAGREALVAGLADLQPSE